ncbi:MAG: class I SAM-dependent methyltransferase [Treponemataceae bacterium]|nr:class I SAM-dependent methyltransferase [Treponemataceae bacterium]
MNAEKIPHAESWFEDEQFWQRFAPIIFDEARWQEVPVVVERILEFLGQSTALRESQKETKDRGAPSSFILNQDSLELPGQDASLHVLDQCCGTGRIAVELALKGASVTGVDITSSYLEAAAESAQNAGVPVELIRHDVRLFVRPEYFDGVVNLYTSFGYFADSEDDVLVVRNAYDSLKKGGYYIVETLSKEIEARDFIESEWFERGGYLVLTHYRILDAWRRLENQWMLIDTRGNRYEKRFCQRLYSATELVDLFSEVGFAHIEVYGGWDLRPYDQDARTLIVVGKK